MPYRTRRKTTVAESENARDMRSAMRREGTQPPDAVGFASQAEGLCLTMQAEGRWAGSCRNTSKPNFPSMEPSPQTQPFIKLAQLRDICPCPDFPFPFFPLTYIAPSSSRNQASKTPIL